MEPVVKIWLSYNWDIGSWVRVRSILALRLDRQRKIGSLPLWAASHPGLYQVALTTHHERRVLTPIEAERTKRSAR